MNKILIYGKLYGEQEMMWDTFYSYSAYIQKHYYMSGISPEPYFHSISDYRAFQNLVREHSIEVVPASLYNLTKRFPDPIHQKYIQ